MGTVETNQEILRAARAVRPLPDVANRVLGIVQTPDYAIDDLVAVVRTDPTLVARVLRLCNSARTGIDRPITSIADAINYLGSRNLVQLVLVTCSAGMFAGNKGSVYSDPQELWQHSIACAFASQAIATRTGQAIGTTAFTVGILHDVGKIALSRVSDEARLLKAVAESDADASLDHIALEHRVFGHDHAAVAGLVASHWQLPTTLADALRGHHDPRLLAAANPLPAILHVADQITLRAGIGNAFPRAPTPIAPAALTRLKLREDDLDSLSESLNRELAKATELLNLDVSTCR